MKDGKWVIKQIRSVLPVGIKGDCDCSADIAYYLEKIEEKLVGKKKGEK